MTTLALALAVTSFLLCLVLTPLVGRVCARCGLLDVPDSIRKKHGRPVPTGGGVAIAVSYVAAYALLLALNPGRDRDFERHVYALMGPVAAAGIVFLTGLVDDWLSLRPWQKIAAESVAGCVAYLAGVRIASLAGYPIPDWLGFPLTIVWLVGCTNAFNLIDGVDGLATGVGLFATATIVIAGLLNRDPGLIIATLPLVGALLGFLRYNFNPASIFLGDSGSLFIGFLLGCYGIVWGQKTVAVLGMTAPLMALAVPLVDTALSVMRRVLRGKPIFAADFGHVHHRLLARGLTPRRVVLLLYGCCGVAAAFSLAQSIARGRLALLVLVSFCVVAWFAVGRIGYVEFQVARQVLFGGTVRRMIDTELALSGMRSTLTKAQTLDDCWNQLLRTGRDIGVAGLKLRVGGTEYSEECETSPDGRRWSIQVALSESVSLVLTWTHRSDLDSFAVGALAGVIESALDGRIRHLKRAAAAAIGGRVELPVRAHPVAWHLQRASGAESK